MSPSGASRLQSTHARCARYGGLPPEGSPGLSLAGAGRFWAKAFENSLAKSQVPYLYRDFGLVPDKALYFIQD